MPVFDGSGCDSVGACCRDTWAGIGIGIVLILLGISCLFFGCANMGTLEAEFAQQLDSLMDDGTGMSKGQLILPYARAAAQFFLAPFDN